MATAKNYLPDPGVASYMTIRMQMEKENINLSQMMTHLPLGKECVSEMLLNMQLLKHSSGATTVL